MPAGWVAAVGRYSNEPSEKPGAWPCMATYGNVWEFLEENRRFRVTMYGGLWRSMGVSRRRPTGWTATLERDGKLLGAESGSATRERAQHNSGRNRRQVKTEHSLEEGPELVIPWG